MSFLPFLCFAVFVLGVIAGTGTVIVRGFQKVEEGFAGIAERQGNFLRMLPPGRHFLVPVLDELVAVIELREFTETIPLDQVSTRGGIAVGINMDLSYRIVRRKAEASEGGGQRVRRERLDVESNAIYNAYYAVDDWKEKTRKEATAIVYNFFGKLDLIKDVLGVERQGSGLKQIGNYIRQLLERTTLEYGVEITGINLFGLQLDENIRMFLTSERRAQTQARLRNIDTLSHLSVKETLGLNADQVLQYRYIEALKEIGQAGGPAVFMESATGINRVFPGIFANNEGGDSEGGSKSGNTALGSGGKENPASLPSGKAQALAKPDQSSARASGAEQKK
jgi:regulator of protease activity HflC (stomatin/prohibitin superfamily)